MRRLPVIIAVLLFLAVLMDPYTLHLNASNYVGPAPRWQLALGVGDLLLVALTGILTLRRVDCPAFAVMSVELPFALLAALVLMLRDGVGRFVHGFGAEEYASFYLCTVLLRVALLQLTRMLSIRAHAAAS